MGFIRDMLEGIPLNSLLRERISIADAEVDRLAEENAALKAEKAELLEEINSLEKELSQLKALANDFVPCQGVLFRVIERIDNEQRPRCDKSIPYCPHCKPPAAMHIDRKRDRATHVCSKCGFIAPFTARQLDIVTKEL